IISPAQLGQQLEKLNARRAALDLQRIEMEPDRTMPAEEVEKAVTDYCAEAAKNLTAFTEERWREFLRTVIVAITFYGKQIKIQGRIPLPFGGSGRELHLAFALASGPGGAAITAVSTAFRSNIIA